MKTQDIVVYNDKKHNRLCLLRSDKIKCPYCFNEESKVMDKRDTEINATRRRRECLKCSKRRKVELKLCITGARMICNFHAYQEETVIQV